jgi:hypothetical protein
MPISYNTGVDYKTTAQSIIFKTEGYQKLGI